MCNSLMSFFWLLLHMVLAVRDHTAHQAFSVDENAYVAKIVDYEASALLKPNNSTGAMEAAKKEIMEIVKGEVEAVRPHAAAALKQAKRDSRWVSKNFVGNLELVHEIEEHLKLVELLEQICGSSFEIAMPVGAIEEAEHAVESGASSLEGSPQLVGAIGDTVTPTGSEAERAKFEPFSSLTELHETLAEFTTEFAAKIIIPQAVDELPAFLRSLEGSGAQPFVVDKCLGGGRFGQVFQAHAEEEVIREVAMKTILFPKGSVVISSEWYMSKHLRANRVKNDALTDEQVYFGKLTALAPRKDQEIKKRYDHKLPGASASGKSYVCLVQPFIPEDFQTLDKLSEEDVQIKTKVLQMAAWALDGMHASGAQHGDIKPDNIMAKVRPQVEVILIDLGNSKITADVRNVRWDVLRFGWTMFVVMRGSGWHQAPLKKMYYGDRGEIYRLFPSGLEEHRKVLEMILEDEGCSMRQVAEELSKIPQAP